MTDITTEYANNLADGMDATYAKSLGSEFKAVEAFAIRVLAAERDTLQAQLEAVRNAALEEAAELIESKAIYTEEAIRSAPSFDILNNIHDVTQSRNARKHATEVRALQSPQKEAE